jgi:hypothetical protein
LPLPDQTYARLRAEAERTGAIASYAAERAGTNLDLDADLESAGVEHLVNTEKAAR